MPIDMNRRRWLVGAGSMTLALPALEYFSPRPAKAAFSAPRLLVYYLPNGRRPEWWVPTDSGGLTFPAQAQGLQPFANDALSLVNLSNTAAIASPRADHAVATGTVMTGTSIPTLEGGVLNNDVSLDQLLVQQLQPDTRFSSLQWSAGEPGPCDVGGSSCAYTQSISWAGPASPLVPTIDPRTAFYRLFGAGVDGLEGVAADVRRTSLQSSVDFVREDAMALQAMLGHQDKMRLDEYLTALTELEKSLAPAGECAATPQSPGGGLSYAERVAAFHELIRLAFQCDQTRVISFMIEFGLSGRSHDFLDAPGGHHSLSHYLNQSGRDRLEIVETWQNDQLGSMLQLLSETTGPAGGTLLDETIVLAIPSMGEGADHDHAQNCPVLFGGGGLLATDGRQIAFSPGDSPPLADLHVTLLEAYGVQGSFGSAGAIFGDDGTSTIAGVVT